MSSEQHIRLAARMYEMRDAAKGIYGERYVQHIAEWKDLLSRIAAKLGVEPLQAVPMIARANPCSDMDIMWLTAAAVDLVDAEPKG